MAQEPESAAKLRLLNLENLSYTQERDGKVAVPFLFLDFRCPGRLALSGSELDDLNVLSLPALGALGHVELNALAFLQ